MNQIRNERNEAFHEELNIAKIVPNVILPVIILIILIYSSNVARIVKMVII